MFKTMLIKAVRLRLPQRILSCQGRLGVATYSFIWMSPLLGNISLVMIDNDMSALIMPE